MSQIFFRTAGNCLLAFAICIGCSGCGDSASPDSEEPEQGFSLAGVEDAPLSPEDERWMIGLLNGHKIAHMRTALVPLPAEDRGGSSYWREEAEYQLSVTRFQDETVSGISYRGELAEDGRLLRFECSLQLGQQPTIFRGEWRDGQLTLERSSAGAESAATTQTVSSPDGFLGFLGVEFSLQNQPMAAGEHRELSRFDVVTNTLVLEELQAERIEEALLLNETQRLLRIKQTTHVDGGAAIEQIIWTDERGQIVKAQSLQTGMEQFVASKQDALAEGDGTIDLAWATSVPITSPLDDPHDLVQVSYRVQLETGDPSAVFAVGNSQRVVLREVHSADVIVTAVRPGEATPGRSPPDLPATAADLQPNAWIQSDNETIVRMAESVAAGEVDSWKVALALERLVHDSIRSHNFNTAMATAAEVAQNLEGDCTEHALLLAGVLRARAIPTRVAIGLVYTNSLGGFGFHMWNEAYIRGDWIPLDATLGRGGIGAGHIKLSTTNMSGSAGLTNLLTVAQVMGQLKIDVVDVQRR